MFRATLWILPVLLLAACIERPPSPRLRAQQVDRSKLGDVLRSEAPAAQVPVGAVFDQSIELVGYDVSPARPKGGEKVKVTFWWRALGPIDDDWQVFVHLEDETKTNPRTLADHWPAGDRFRTAAWREGDVVRDEFTFTAPSAGPGRIELWTGLFHGDQRMPLTKAGRGRSDGANRVMAGIIPLE